MHYAEKIPAVDGLEPKNPSEFLFQAARTRCRKLVSSGTRRARSKSSTKTSRGPNSLGQTAKKLLSDKFGSDKVIYKHWKEIDDTDLALTIKVIVYRAKPFISSIK
uniref:Uncharacterized protein n=1 Tax=Cacopsylla melanoneura TaxID=428564 RepID=A0A8D9BMD4_9HEMI